MGTIKTTADSVYRDRVSPGSSTLHEPIKIDIRNLFGVVDTSVSAALAGASLGSAIPYATRALMYAATGVAVNSLGVVYADSTDAYNAVYVKTGSGSGAANWSITALLLPTTLQSQVASLVANLGNIDGLLAGTLGEVTHLINGYENFRSDRDGVAVPGGRFQNAPKAFFRGMTEEGMVWLEVDETGAGFSSGDGPDVAVTTNAVRLWSGAVTDTSIKFAADIEGSGSGLTVLEVSADAFFTVKTFESSVQVPAVTDKASGQEWRSFLFKATGLAAATSYSARLVVDGKPSGAVLSFKTAPAVNTAAGFRFAMGSCSDLKGGTIAKSFPAIASLATKPLFFIHMGDLMYSNIADDDVRLPRAQNTRAWRDNASVQALLAVCPIVYMYDDHDFSSNDAHWDTVYASGTNYSQIGKNTRKAVFETTPIYDQAQLALGERDPDKLLLAQQWTIGKTRFIMPDARSNRRFEVGTPTALGIGTNPPGSWNQLQWLKDALVQAGTDGATRVFLILSPGWVGSYSSNWGDHFPGERTAICNYLRDTAGIPAVTLLCGDFHYSAIDDGTNADYATGGGSKFAAIMSSPLYRTNLNGGGPWTWQGVNTEYRASQEQFAVIDVTSAGEWSVGLYDATTYDPITPTAPTLIATYSSTVVTPSVQFVSPSSSGSAGGVSNIPLSRNWFAKSGTDNGTVSWSTSDGQSGVATFKSNSSGQTIPVTRPASGSITVTIASPVNMTLGIQTTHTLTAV